MNIPAICNFDRHIYSTIPKHTSSLVYYSHIPLIIICLFVTLLILIKGRNEFKNKILLFIFIPFGLCMFFSLLILINNRGDVIMTAWVLTLLVEPIIYIGGIYLIQFLIEGKDISFKQKLYIGLLYLPIILLLLTKLSINSFNIDNYSNMDGSIVNLYTYLIETIYLILIIKYTIKQIILNKNWYLRKKIIFISIGIILFLILFSLGNIIEDYTDDWEFGAFGLFGMPIFIGFLVYNIITFNIFSIKLIGRNILVITLLILIGSLITITDPQTSHTVTMITFIVSILLGVILIKSTRKEVQQLEKIELLASNLNLLNSTLLEKVKEQTVEISHAYELEKKARRDLEKLNETKNQFIKITQHNIRIPITSIDNKINSILSGKFGKINNNLNKNLLEVNYSLDHLRQVADDFINITKLKTGDSILNTSIKSLLPILENILKELRIEIENLKLSVTYPTNQNSWPNIKIDSNKIREVLTVIIENAIRYNIKGGKIKIETKMENTFKITIKNTGFGLTYKENNNLLNRSFYRSIRAKEINPNGMGIGLSVSRSIIEAHHGTLTINSDGEGMGAKVIVTLPIDFLSSLNII